ncbi:DUF2182 domain-containing protein [uncultured Piscinibacter sp.]|uniref:DUF2182 domain-containing protein n=1 Tax=uncultured Piscinibacter sp. TaxID=1131835 RepID=UPI002616DFE8|nr:DUF2182 domain-containing protein [uncultured Piscinibacter sp.]
MSTRVPDPIDGASSSELAIAANAAKRANDMTPLLLVLSVSGWAALAWMALDMGHPLVQLAMPASSNWTAGNLLAIWSMWAIMMAAMMLPSAMPMVLAFTSTCRAAGERLRASAFVGAYLLIWSGFSVAAAAMQWSLQAMNLLSPMIVSASAGLTGTLLLIAGVYQFSPLKRTCLGHCRTPMASLIGGWRAGAYGGLVMGLRHGLFCLGCCWALMALLFVGGVMNLAWIAALSVAAAIEKLAPRGAAIARILGYGLITAGAVRLLTPLMR